jgi:hypothetical protein
MLILKLAVVTCILYLAAAVVIEATQIALTHLLGMIGFFSTRPKLVGIVFFGTIWLVSFLLAWRIVIAPVFAKTSN